MAGTPKRTADHDSLEYTTLGDEVMQMIEEGRTLSEICMAKGIGRRALTDWLEAPERTEEVARARVRGATAMVEHTVAIADGKDPLIDPNTLEYVNDAQRDRLRIHSRQWVAERAAREVWGAPTGKIEVNLNVLHLQALRQRAVRIDGVEDATILSETAVDNSASGTHAHAVQRLT